MGRIRLLLVEVRDGDEWEDNLALYKVKFILLI